MSVRGESLTPRAAAPSPVVGTIHKELKIHLPDLYEGDRNKLWTFLTQVELYISFNSTRFNSEVEQVLWVVTLLRGPTYGWIEIFINDYMDNRYSTGAITTAMMDKTKGIFRTFVGFKEAIITIFRDLNKKRTVVQAIQNLRQHSSVIKYTSTF